TRHAGVVLLVDEDKHAGRVRQAGGGLPPGVAERFLDLLLGPGVAILLPAPVGRARGVSLRPGVLDRLPGFADRDDDLVLGVIDGDTDEDVTPGAADE